MVMRNTCDSDVSISVQRFALGQLEPLSAGAIVEIV